MSDICKNLSVIPQYGGTYWFNAILMSLLYSDSSHKRLLKASKNWNSLNSFLMIFKKYSS